MQEHDNTNGQDTTLSRAIVRHQEAEYKIGSLKPITESVRLYGLKIVQEGEWIEVRIEGKLPERRSNHASFIYENLSANQR